VDESATSVDFVLRYLLSEPGMHHVRAASPGTTARNKTVSFAVFRDMPIPAPPLEEQHRIASWLSDVEIRSNALRTVALIRTTHTSHLTRAAIDAATVELTSSRTVRELVSVVTDLVRPGDDPCPARLFVGLEHISPNLGQRVGSKAVGGEKGRKLRFKPNDILYGYLRPYQNKVWIADIDGLCSVEQYVLRAKLAEDAELVSHILRGAGVYEQVVAATNSLQLPRLGSNTLLSLEIPWPKSTRERADAIERLRQANAVTVRLQDLQKGQAVASKALLPAALNQVFGSLN
jgi:type I restriction enzyme S subunit